MRFDHARSALVRGGPSKLARWLMEQPWVNATTSVFDYGCGHGEDVAFFRERGLVHCTGWDPFLRPDTPKAAADVVILAYVVNVVPDAAERTRILAEAWSLTRRMLFVSARTNPLQAPSTLHGDGYRTSANTFQRIFTLAELRTLVASVTGDAPVREVGDDAVAVFKPGD
jgi:DNA phosphorothioation-associated putative methyltransferase